MIILFLLMMVGFILNKVGLLNKAGEKTLSAVVVNAANPAMVLAASINKEGTIQGIELLRTFGLIIVVYIILIILAWIITRVLRVPKGQRGAYQNMTVFSNIGFMGFPLVSAMFGSEAMLYASLFVIPYNVLIYTYAYFMMDADLKAAGSENAATSAGSDDGTTSREKSSTTHSAATLRKIINIGTIASILTIIIYLSQIHVPEFIESTVTHLSHLTAPLSMIVIGSSMADMKLKEMFTDVRLLIYSAVKLLLIPIVGVTLIKLTGADPLFVGVCLVMLGTPIGSMTAMIAQTHGSNYELAARGVALTTVLSVVTLPLISMILL